MVFSLNVTGSFVNDIFRVVRSIRFRLYGLSLGKLDVLEIISHLINMNDMIFSHFLAEKKKFFRIKKHSATNTTFLTQKYTFQRVLNQIPEGGGLPYLPVYNAHPYIMRTLFFKTLSRKKL